MGDKYDEKMGVWRSLGIIEDTAKIHKQAEDNEAVKIQLDDDQLFGMLSNGASSIFTNGEVKGYESLASVLKMAYNRAAKGKGMERHSHGESFSNQQIVKETLLLGHGGISYQIRKKTLEAATKLSGEKRINEYLDVIVHAAAGVIAEMESMEGRYGR